MIKLDSNEILMLQQSNFQLDCPTMVLENSSSRRKYEGSGYIRQDADGYLEFRMFSSDSNHKYLDAEESSRVTGQIIPEDEYYNLSIIDAKARRWKSDKILPNISGGGSIDKIILTDKIFELKSMKITTIKRDNQLLKACFFTDLDFPCNSGTETTVSIAGRQVSMSSETNVAIFTVCGNEFRLKKLNDNITLLEVIISGDGLGNYPEKVIEEIFQFGFGRPMFWAILETHKEDKHDVRIRSHVKDYKRRRIVPPILYNIFKNGEYVYNLIDCYSKYVTSMNRDDWHPVSHQVQSIHSSLEVTLEAQALSISVSAEAILKILFSDTGKVTPEYMKQVEETREIIQKSSIDEEIKKRLMGFIGSMKNIGAKKMFYKLVEANILSEKHVKAWGELRNSTTHGDFFNKRKIQEIFSLCDSVTVLCYNMIFYAIGYRGKYTDYSDLGWPDKMWYHSFKLE